MVGCEGVWIKSHFTCMLCLCAHIDASINLPEHSGRQPIDMLNNRVSLEAKSKYVVMQIYTNIL